MDTEPCVLDEALRGPNSKEWQAALRTWVIEALPDGYGMAIPCDEVLRKKRGPNGEIQSYRVRIVAGGHKQVEGVDYTETFSTVHVVR
jgi:hypothetical protein